MPEDFAAASTRVGEYAAALIRPGMRLGLGTGRTATAFLEALAPRLRAGLAVQALCTSEATAERARRMGIGLLDSSVPELDLDVDGTDELDSELNLLKGRGGALVREKMVASRSRRLWVLGQESKVVARLGSTHDLPVEVTKFDWRGTQATLERLLPCRVRLRGGEAAFVTDNGNYLLDLNFEVAPTGLERVAEVLQAVPGVLGHGLFLGLATAALLSDGEHVRVLGDLEARRPILPRS